MPAIRGQFTELFQLSLTTRTQLALLEELSDYTFDEQPPEIERIYKVMDRTGPGHQEFGVGGFGLPQEKDGELGGVHYDEIGKWFPQSFTFNEFNLGYIVSHEMQRDDRWDLAGERARAFGRSFRILPEILGARVFNEGFSATTQSGIMNAGRLSPDARPLFDTAHPNPGPGGGTQSNRPASGGADFSAATYEAAQISMGKVTNDRGFPVNIRPDTLWVPWSGGLYHRAKETVEGPWRVDTLARVENVAQKIMPVQVVPSYYLTNPRAWFLLNSKQNGLRWIWRERFTRDMWKARENRAIHVNGYCSFDFGYAHWFGLYGDPGLGG